MNIAQILQQRQEAHEARMHENRSQQTATSGPSNSLSAQQKLWAAMAEQPQLATMKDPQLGNYTPYIPGLTQTQAPAPQASPQQIPGHDRGAIQGGGIYRGSVRWYNPEKEMGIIDSTETRSFAAGEVVVLASNLKGVVPCSGDVCTFQVAKTRCGYKAIELTWLQGEGAADRDRRAENACASIQAGKIMQFDQWKGFGFIRCEDIRPLFQKDIFFMKTQLKGQPSAYKEGMDVFFRFHNSQNGPQATHVAMRRADLEVLPAGEQPGPLIPGLMAPEAVVVPAGVAVVGPRSVGQDQPDAKRRRRSGWDVADPEPPSAPSGQPVSL
eukprot:gnl/MRDRNA2_/MRDRNA2_29579_c0_seq1.p1 gnl/MRDRNA2_/MRDRNA2_29579_c0~~gnl/MRDRNA2_/MRDRNA2_29579_c0_seq1.p1  ORF type:complete len:326 (+),score=52.59 gnl/MRDRNA2_/MRDRNA2_29579_c0_seq1:91-1068(+)